MVKNLVAILVLSFILASAGQSNIYGQDPDENLPVPKFDTLAQQRIADELREAYQNMRRHLCDKPDNPPAQWQTRFGVLLGELIVAQHRTVWAATGEFDGDLVELTRTLKPFYD